MMLPNLYYRPDYYSSLTYLSPKYKHMYDVLNEFDESNIEKFKSNLENIKFNDLIYLILNKYIKIKNIKKEHQEKVEQKISEFEKLYQVYNNKHLNSFLSTSRSIRLGSYNGYTSIELLPREIWLMITSFLSDVVISDKELLKIIKLKLIKNNTMQYGERYFYRNYNLNLKLNKYRKTEFCKIMSMDDNVFDKYIETEIRKENEEKISADTYCSIL